MARRSGADAGQKSPGPSTSFRSESADGRCRAIVQTCFCIFSVFLWPFLSWSARRNSAFGRVGLDIFDHLQFSLAEISDQLAGLVRRRLAVTRGLDQPAAFLRLFAQRGESLQAGPRQLARWRRRNVPCAWAWFARIVTTAAISGTIRRIIKGASPARSCGPTSSDRRKVPIIGIYRLRPARNGTIAYA